MRIAIIGHFGSNENFNDGQTVKVKSLYNTLRSELDESIIIDKIDTYYFHNKKLSSLLGLLKRIAISDKIIVLPATRGRRILFKYMYVLKKVFKKEIYHDAIGGALVGELDENPKWVKYLNSFESNWIESEIQAEQMFKKGITNVRYIPNFKDLEPVSQDSLKEYKAPPFRFCIFSRIEEKKGIDEAVQAIKDLNAGCGGSVATLDIYGPIQKGHEQWFEDIKSSFTQECRYCGVAAPDSSVNVLKDYFMLLFPTQYYTEGMPGTIIDAMFAGLPVLARRWAYCDQMITNGYNGISYDFDSPQELYTQMKSAIDDPNRIFELRRNCINEAQKYSKATVTRKILDALQL